MTTDLRKARPPSVEPPPAVHSAWTTPDGLTPCCGEDPRAVGVLTLDPPAVTCAVLPDARKRQDVAVEPGDLASGVH